MANTSGATRYTSNQESLTRTRSSGLYSGRGSARHHAGCTGAGGNPCVASSWQVASARMRPGSSTQSTHRRQLVMHLLDGDGVRPNLLRQAASRSPWAARLPSEVPRSLGAKEVASAWHRATPPVLQSLSLIHISEPTRLLSI